MRCINNWQSCVGGLIDADKTYCTGVIKLRGHVVLENMSLYQTNEWNTEHCSTTGLFGPVPNF